MESSERKGLELERLIFFSDAIVAIAITLLALALKLDVPAGRRLMFADLVRPWKTYLAFILSFINIAGFWQTHHTIFCYSRKIDRKMLALNLCWLFFIVILPFTTSVLSVHFADTPAIFCYALNIFMLSLFQKLIWDYGDDELTGNLSSEKTKRIDVMFTLQLLNGIVAMIVSFYYPVAAFILLFFKIPLFIVASFYIASAKRKAKVNENKSND
jgi:uncharacterized membrane protein